MSDTLGDRDATDLTRLVIGSTLFCLKTRAVSSVGKWAMQRGNDTPDRACPPSSIMMPSHSEHGHFARGRRTVQASIQLECSSLGIGRSDPCRAMQAHAAHDHSHDEQPHVPCAGNLSMRPRGTYVRRHDCPTIWSLASTSPARLAAAAGSCVVEERELRNGRRQAPCRTRPHTDRLRSSPAPCFRRTGNVFGLLDGVWFFIHFEKLNVVQKSI